jgi:alkanesulfonate monooxygenase SsuD/methylene tetrahydromethanopterin reductase-like flavin-dependent oxidoreductase (luciferase family)
MDRLAEQLEIIAGSWAPGPFSFRGEHYAVEGLDALPKPVQDPLPLLMGGSAAPRGAALAARFASEYNVVHETPAGAQAAAGRIRAACEDAGRDPGTMTFSLMHGFLIGADEDDLRERGERLSARTGMPVEQLRRDWLSGTPEQFAARLREYEAAGVERVMLQHHLVDDHAALEIIAAAVVPALA